MECREFQENLNNYIEDTLPLESKKVFEEHFAACRKCSESLDDLKKTIAHIKDLEEIEPPLWLTQKVMAKVREEADAQQKKGVFWKLFSFFNASMPLKTVAGIAILVITIFVFRDIRPVVQTIRPAIEETTEEVPLKEKKKSRSLKKEKTAHQPASVGRSDSNRSSRDEAMPFKETYSPSKPAEQQISPAPALEQEKSSSFAGAPSPEKDNLRMKAETSSVSKAMEAKMIDNIIFTVIVSDIEFARKEVWKALSQSGGKVTRTESYKNKHLIFTEIGPEKIKELNDKLKNIGEVKQIDIDSSKTQGNLSVKIEIVGM